MNELINQILLFKENEDDYTSQEIKAIKSNFKNICREKIKRASKIFIEAINTINHQ